MGSKNAAFGDECGVYATEQPLFTREECASLRKEAESNIASGTGASSFTMTDSNRDVAVHEMAQAQHWLKVLECRGLLHSLPLAPVDGARCD